MIQRKGLGWSELEANAKPGQRPVRTGWSSHSLPPPGRFAIAPTRCRSCGGMTRCEPCMVCQPLRAKVERPMPPPPDDERFHLPIAELEEVSPQVINSLESKGLIFVGQLLMVPPDELRSIDGLGPKCLESVLAAVRKLFAKSNGGADG